ncbi:hypothetical protein NHN26_01205 [Rhodovulum tesquicola]|uniref:hypothetical protein n=1 Tax=Rhodovulum tesquicola TaxID=540254 RepID=UPI002097A8FD|nr:hypothetical protein [Rhodovulum tesquicola]MCO8143829.1 hypothetical protein [Rhodovulum tesquicola]
MARSFGDARPFDDDTCPCCGDNIAVAALAALLLGPFGMFYATRVGAIVMIVLTVLVALPTLGFGVLLTLPICVLWAVLAAMRNASHAGAQPV